MKNLSLLDEIARLQAELRRLRNADIDKEYPTPDSQRAVMNLELGINEDHKE